MPLHTTPDGVIETLEWGDGPTLVLLLHAAAAGPGGLTALARHLSAPGRRIIAPAFHGYGGTRIIGATDPIEAHVTVARAVLNLYPARRRIMFGHSMGGLVALAAAPAVDAIIVHEPIVTSLLRDDDPADLAARDWDRAIVARLEGEIGAGRLEAGIRVFVEAWNEVAWDALPASVRTRLIAAAPGLAREIRAGSARRIDPGRITAPLLILQGADSPPITHRMTARLHAMVLGSRRVVVDGCGHMGPVQAAGSVAAAIGAAGVRGI